MAIANVLITSLPEATSPSANDYLILQGKNTQRIKWSALLDKIYPVGCIYQSVSSTSPASFLGGTWEQIKDRFILAAGDIYAAGSTGGEAEHTLTESEMPKHNHKTAKGERHDDEMGTKFEQYDTYQAEASVKPGYYWEASTLSAGNSQPHNNMPPYIATYVWMRIA